MVCFCNFPLLSMFSPPSKASRKEGIWLLSCVFFYCLYYMVAQEPCSSAHHLCGPPGCSRPCVWCPHQLLNSIYLPVPLGSSAIVFWVLLSNLHIQHQCTLKDTVSFPNQSSCCSAAPQFPRMDTCLQKGCGTFGSTWLAKPPSMRDLAIPFSGPQST